MALALVGLLGAGLLLGDDDGEPASAGREEGERRGSTRVVPRPVPPTTRSRSATSTTTTAPPPPVPVLPGAGARVVLVGGQGSELLDLDTGIAVELPVPPSAYGLVAAGEGVVFIDGGRARYLAVPVGAPPGDPVELGPAEQVFASEASAGVWLSGAPPGSEGERLEATLVDLTGRRRAGPRDVSNGWVVGAHPAGLVVQAAGRIYVVGDDGQARALVTGEALGVSRGWLLVRACDDEMECELVLWDPELRSRVLDGIVVSSFGGWLAVDAAGQRAAMLLYRPGGADVLEVDLVSGALREVETGGGDITGMGWLPGDLGLLVATPDELVRVHERDGDLRHDELRDRGASSLVILTG